MMRFDLEVDLLEGRLRVKELPEAWRGRVQADLGLVTPDDRDGCLQDVHWYAGAIGGGFQGYTIGNILSAQFYDAAVKAHPEIPREIARRVQHPSSLKVRTCTSTGEIRPGRASLSARPAAR